MFPEPGASAAGAATTISFRGAAPGELGAVSVVGDRSGAHDGSWIAHSDGHGASFDPATPFVAGEHVTVHTQLNVTGASNGTFSYTIATPGANNGPASFLRRR